MINEKIRKLAAILGGGGIVFICWILRPFVKIRFGNLYTSRIGHLGYNMDNYLSTRDARSISIFSYDNKIANNELMKYWKSVDNIYFNRMAKLPYSFLLKKLPLSPMLISWEGELNPRVSLSSKTESNIMITAEIYAAEKKLLDDIGVKKGKYICLHNRDDAYLNELGGDHNYHDYRDFEFIDYSKAIGFISGVGMRPVRVGKTVKQECNDISYDNLLSLTNDVRNDFMDLSVIHNSLFFVGCNSGISIVSRLYRKPQLMINYIPFVIGELSVLSEGSVFIPKKLFNKKSGRFLTFSEMAVLEYDIHYKGNFFLDNDLKVVNNTPEEIAAAVGEMYLRLTGGWNENKEQQSLQNKFWDSIKDVPYCKEIKDDLGMLISSRFLEMNPELI